MVLQIRKKNKFFSRIYSRPRVIGEHSYCKYKHTHTPTATSTNILNAEWPSFRYVVASLVFINFSFNFYLHIEVSVSARTRTYSISVSNSNGNQVLNIYSNELNCAKAATANARMNGYGLRLLCWIDPSKSQNNTQNESLRTKEKRFCFWFTTIVMYSNDAPNTLKLKLKFGQMLTKSAINSSVNGAPEL